VNLCLDRGCRPVRICCVPKGSRRRDLDGDIVSLPASRSHRARRSSISRRRPAPTLRPAAPFSPRGPAPAARRRRRLADPRARGTVTGRAAYWCSSRRWSHWIAARHRTDDEEVPRMRGDDQGGDDQVWGDRVQVLPLSLWSRGRGKDSRAATADPSYRAEAADQTMEMSPLLENRRRSDLRLWLGLLKIAVVARPRRTSVHAAALAGMPPSSGMVRRNVRSNPGESPRRQKHPAWKHPLTRTCFGRAAFQATTWSWNCWKSWQRGNRDQAPVRIPGQRLWEAGSTGIATPSRRLTSSRGWAILRRLDCGPCPRQIARSGPNGEFRRGRLLPCPRRGAVSPLPYTTLSCSGSPGPAQDRDDQSEGVT